jgi:hypothetical protein
LFVCLFVTLLVKEEPHSVQGQLTRLQQSSVVLFIQSGSGVVGAQRVRTLLVKITSRSEQNYNQLFLDNRIPQVDRDYHPKQSPLAVQISVELIRWLRWGIYSDSINFLIMGLIRYHQNLFLRLFIS